VRRGIQLVVGYSLLLGGVLIGLYGLFWVAYEGEGGQHNHPFVLVGIVVLVIALPVVAAGFFVLHSKRLAKRSH